MNERESAFVPMPERYTALMEKVRSHLTRSVFGLATGALVAVASMSTAAYADAIDGRWCHQDGRSLTIRGPAITTPGGNRITGDYGRHNFSYVVPASEPAAGQIVEMRLLSEYLMHLRLAASPRDGTPEVWNRCPPDVSRRATVDVTS